MSWISLAMGLIREAATTEMGQEVLNDIRSNTFKGRNSAEAPPAEPETIDAWRQSVERRLRTAETNTEMLVRMLNGQDEALVKVQRRQRIWNLLLSATILVLIAAWLWLG